jgi:hypothetical protein
MFYWSVDSSSAVDTPNGVNSCDICGVDKVLLRVSPAGILRGDRGLPETRYSTGWNGNSTNIYGGSLWCSLTKNYLLALFFSLGKGRMPHYVGSTAINGGMFK